MRVHRLRRRVRLADVRPSGRLRLDGVARYLQDVAADDMREVGLADEVAWVVRRTRIDVRRWPRYDDVVDLTTWCSGVGAAWAERRTTIERDGRPSVETTSLWVSLDRGTMRPVAPSESFRAAYGVIDAGPRLRTRLVLPAPDPAIAARPWPLRAADTDLLGHVNNAVAWAAVEDELSRRPEKVAVVGAEVEYRAALEPGCDPTISSRVDGDDLLVWLTVPGADGAAVSARVRTAPPARRSPSPPPT